MNFSKNLFWDIDVEALNFQEHVRFIIERVITRGDLKDWKQIKDFYGIEKLKEESTKIRTLDDKSLNLLATVFQLEKTQFRCYTLKQ